VLSAESRAHRVHRSEVAVDDDRISEQHQCEYDRVQRRRPRHSAEVQAGDGEQYGGDTDRCGRFVPTGVEAHPVFAQRRGAQTLAVAPYRCRTNGMLTNAAATAAASVAMRTFMAGSLLAAQAAPT